MQENELLEKFLIDSEDFIQEFQSTFVEYFVNLCASYDKFYPNETLEEIANIVYKDIFISNSFIATLEKDTFKEILKDGVMIGFLINRSMFFLLQNYVKETKENVKYKEHIETMIFCITKYINQFEKNISEKNRLQPLHINFDTSENFSSDSNIFDIFKDIKNRGDEVTFFNLYKGIPIEHHASIVDIDDEKIVFKTIITQEIAMKLDGAAYILKDSNFDKYIKADIVYSNFANNTVALSNFTCLFNMPATNRKFVRVHPEIMAEVTLSSEEELTTKGKLFDLSIDGLGVISEENNGIYAGANVHISFQLEISGSNSPSYISVDGEVLNIIEYSNSYRYCIKILPKVDAEEKIENYARAREVEILHSLDKEIESYK